MEAYLGDMFDTEEEILTGQKQGALLNAYGLKARDCAHSLPLPELERKPGTPAGLKNQGATCYLNSLLQVIFYTPEFRSLIMSLPLCLEDDVTKRSDFLNSESKFNFVMGFQKLFSELQILDSHTISTEHLNKAFGWEKAEHLQQHDLHEAMRVILDTMERALTGTLAEQQVKSNFKGLAAKYITCLNCNKSRDTPEPFFELMAQVKDVPNLNASIQSMITPTEMMQGNRITCDNCGTKTDSLLGFRLVNLPNILIITLGRFEFDLERLDQVKITTPLAFDLELNMAAYGVSDTNTEYELYGIVIHRGSAHGGHYFAYVRDVLGESSWKENLEGLNKKKEEEKKEEEQKKQTKTKKEESKEQIQKESYQLKQPTDTHLTDYWYQLNDNFVAPISSKKIATQFGGSQCAYILFYRRRGPQIKIPQVPSYFRKVIEARNAQLQQARDFYNNEKQHLLLKIAGTETRLNKKTKIGELLEVYSPAGVLVNKEQFNSLDYYPQQLTEQDKEKTIEEADLTHQSNWLVMDPVSEEYKQIKRLIGKEKIPVDITIAFESKFDHYITTQDSPFVQLRQYIESHYKVPYEHQIITLDGNHRQQKNLAQTSNNDELSLLQLKIIHTSQLFVDKKSGAGEASEHKEKQPELLTIIVERDDEPGIKRHYLPKTILLSELLQRIRQSEGVQGRRLRWLNGNRLFFLDQYSKTLEQLGVEESLVRLRLERGEVPEKGEVCVKVRMQSKFQAEGTHELYELVVDPSISLNQLKKMICQKFGLEPLAHKLYRTDWMGQPSRPITKQNLNLFEACFANEQKICLRDNESPTNLELVHFNVSITKTGFPDNSEKGFDIKIEETKTLKNLKQMMLEVPLVKALAEGKNYKQLRLRQLKRDYMFGNIFRGHDKVLKSTNIPDCSNLVLQILDKEEELGEDDIVLVIKSRDSEKKVYRENEEFLWKASKVPKLAEFKKALLTFKDIQLGPEEIRVAKYYHNDFEWIELTEENFKKWLEARKKKKETESKTKEQAKANKAKKNQGEIPKHNKQGHQKTEEPNKQEVNKPQQKAHTPKQTESLSLKPEQKEAHKPEQIKTEGKGDKKQRKQGKKQKQPRDLKKDSNQHLKQQGSEIQTVLEGVDKKQAHQGQDKKQPKKKHQQAQQKKDPFEQQNLRKAPFLFKDGDIIGYGFACQILEDDDFQTEEDQHLRRLKQIETGKKTTRRHKKEVPFPLDVDF